MTEGSWPKVDGDILYASEVNLLRSPVQQVYASTALDVTASGAAGSDENSLELTAITSTTLKGSTYVKIVFTFQAEANTYNNASECICSYKIEAKETGGAYGDSLAYVKLLSLENNSGGVLSEVWEIVNNTIVWYHTLTAGQLTNGVQFKLWTKATTGTSQTATITNRQVLVELV